MPSVRRRCGVIFPGKSPDFPIFAQRILERNFSMHLSRLRPVLAIRLFADDTKAFGPGVATLLHHVDALHSLRAAAAAMGMAYSKAWRITK